jgi:hypothetical protein
MIARGSTEEKASHSLQSIIVVHGVFIGVDGMSVSPHVGYKRELCALSFVVTEHVVQTYTGL